MVIFLRLISPLKVRRKFIKEVKIKFYWSIKTCSAMGIRRILFFQAEDPPPQNIWRAWEDSNPRPAA